MAVLRGAQMTKVAAGTTPDVGRVHGTLRAFHETVTLAAQTTSDTIEVALLPKGAVVLGFVLTTTVSLSTSTIAIGVTGTVDKYKDALVFTAVDTPTWYGNAAALNTPLAAEETLFITIGTATLPASGSLQVTTLYCFN